jgi:hypothetical protein
VVLTAIGTDEVRVTRSRSTNRLLDFTFGLDAVRAKNVGRFSRFNNLDGDGETTQGTT